VLLHRLLDGCCGEACHAQKHWLSIRRTTMARSKITERNGKIVFQGVEYTIPQWSIKKKAEADVDARQKELAEQRKRPVFIPSENTLDRIRLFLWLVIAVIAFPFACVVQALFWLLDLVAGDKFPRLRWGVQKKEKKDD
jgi:hypothetical protein